MFHERPEVIAIRSESDLARRLVLHARLATETARRIAPFQLMVQAAAGADPAAEAAATGQLAVSEEECRDVLWSMTDGMLWHRLVKERSWTDERFAEWLGRIWVHVLVAPDADLTTGAE